MSGQFLQNDKGFGRINLWKLVYIENSICKKNFECIISLFKLFFCYNVRIFFLLDCLLKYAFEFLFLLANLLLLFTEGLCLYVLNKSYFVTKNDIYRLINPKVGHSDCMSRSFYVETQRSNTFKFNLGNLPVGLRWLVCSTPWSIIYSVSIVFDLNWPILLGKRKYQSFYNKIEV